MGANAQTTVPTFTAAQVLTADQMNQSARTGVPVFAGTTERDAAFGGTGEKTLAEGQLCYLESTNVVQYYDGSNWATVGPTTQPGLELIKTQTIGTTVSSVTVSDVFSSSYDNYRIMVYGGSATGTINLLMTLGSTNTGYYLGIQGVSYAGVASTAGNNNAAAWTAGASTSNGHGLICDLANPFLSDQTVINGQYIVVDTGSNMAVYGGFLNNTTSYTAFTLTTSSGTITGGTIRVYGYRN